MTAAVEVRDLAVRFDGAVDALRGVSFRLDAGETLAVIGESGAGKSTLALCMAGLIQGTTVRGSVLLDSQELLGASNDTLRDLRWKKVALTMQGAPFNPVMTVGAQLEEPLREGGGHWRRTARERAAAVADELQLDPALLDRHPHQLSGGQRCRASLAMAMVLDPAVLVLDEPTQGLDSVTAADVVDAVNAAVRRRGVTLIVITHDLTVAARMAAATMVLYAGRSVEEGKTASLLASPAHPYTAALVSAYPVMSTTRDLRPIRGRPPDARAIPSGCAYHPRCTQTVDVCSREIPALEGAGERRIACHLGGLQTLVEVVDVWKTFSEHGRSVTALRGVTITIREGESVGLLGPSGSGKSTLARIVTGHLRADRGTVTTKGASMTSHGRQGDRQARRRVQLVMQDPWDALSPRLTVAELVREPLDIEATVPMPEREARVARALDNVGLPATAAFLAGRAHQLSGGQLQRVALARALVAEPKLLVADEPTSMLDPSEQARMLLAMRERQVEMGLGLLLVSHDLALIRKVCDRIVVIDCGQIVEEGPSNVVSTSPQSVTGRRLMQTAPAFRPAPRAHGEPDRDDGGKSSWIPSG